MQSTQGYSRAQIALHWLIVLLIAGQYLLHKGIETAWAARLDGSIPNEPSPNPHAIAGMLILLLTLARIVLRIRHGAPELPAHEPQALKFVAGATHLAFYALLILMPVSGAAAWVLGFEQPAEGHQIMATVMMALIVLHILGAVVQKVWLKSGVMERMSPARILKRDG